MSDWQDDIINDVDEALNEWGSTEAYIYQPGTPATFNPGTGTYAGGTDPVALKVNAVFKTVSTHMIDNTNILATDKEVRISPKGLLAIPEVGDKIKRGDKIFTIIRDISMKPADKNLMLRYVIRAD